MEMGIDVTKDGCIGICFAFLLQPMQTQKYLIQAGILYVLYSTSNKKNQTIRDSLS